MTETASFRHLPVRLLMAADENLSEMEIEELTKDGNNLMDDLKKFDESSTGTFVAPNGGAYLDMKSIQQVYI